MSVDFKGWWPIILAMMLGISAVVSLIFTALCLPGTSRRYVLLFVAISRGLRLLYSLTFYLAAASAASAGTASLLVQLAKPLLDSRATTSYVLIFGPLLIHGAIQGLRWRKASGRKPRSD